MISFISSCGILHSHDTGKENSVVANEKSVNKLLVMSFDIA